MIKLKKIFRLILIFTITALLLTSCNVNPSSLKETLPGKQNILGVSDSGVIKLPNVNEPITLTVFAGLDSNLKGVIDDYNDNQFFQELEKRTRVHLEFIMPGTEKEQEVYNEMVASGGMADIITHEGNLYPDGWDAAVDDGLYLDMTPYLDTYLKDYNRIRTSSPLLEKSTTTAKGRIVSIHIINTEPQGPWMGLQVRKDWLDDLGLDVPVTYKDWEEMLQLFKSKKGAYAPLSIGQNGYMSISHALSAGFGVMESFMQIDGKVVYGPITEGWKSYLTLLNQWYKKGLIDPDFMINGAWQVDKSMVISGETGAWNAMYTMISEYEKAGNMHVIPVAPPVINKGDQLHIRKEDTYMGNSVAISASCKFPEVAMQLLNYLYTDEGALLANYGIKNDTFVYGPGGKPMVTDKIRNNPVYSMPQAQALYLMPPSRFGGLYDWTRELSAVPEKDIKALDIWAAADDDYILPGKLYYAGEEAGQRAAIISAVTSYVNESTVKFIIGSSDINKEWEHYISTIEDMGIKKATQITQNALDHFNK